MEIKHALLTDRVKAIVIDSIVIIGLMFAASEILAFFDDVSIYIKVIIFVFAFIIYEPLFVSMYGQTIGHSYSKIRVVKDDNSFKNKISFPIALVRYFIKAVLGWISLLTVSSNKKKQALHDLMVKSIVIRES
jgi:uncharacterized RDD family membrane protein YckC